MSAGITLHQGEMADVLRTTRQRLMDLEAAGALIEPNRRRTAAPAVWADLFSAGRTA